MAIVCGLCPSRKHKINSELLKMHGKQSVKFHLQRCAGTRVLEHVRAFKGFKTAFVSTHALTKCTFNSRQHGQRRHSSRFPCICHGHVLSHLALYPSTVQAVGSMTAHIQHPMLREVHCGVGQGSGQFELGRQQPRLTIFVLASFEVGGGRQPDS